MKRRTDDHYGQRTQDLGVGDMPLWAQSPTHQSPDDRKRDVERCKERLLPVVMTMAQARGPEGITASEVLADALVRGVLTPAPSSDPRRHAWIGPWLSSLAQRGVLVPKTVRLPDGSQLHVKRQSQRNQSHANPNGIYLHPQVAA